MRLGNQLGLCRVVEELMLAVGAAIGYYQGDVKLIIEDIGALRPTFFAGVPRVFDRVYSGILNKVRVVHQIWPVTGCSLAS